MVVEKKFFFQMHNTILQVGGGIPSPANYTPVIVAEYASVSLNMPQ